MSSIKTIFKNNWHELQDSIKNHWRKLSDEDLSKIDADYERFLAKLEKVYECDREEANKLLYKFLYKEGLLDLKYRAKEVWDNTIEMKNQLKNGLQRSSKLTKEKINDIEESFSHYVKEKPYKSVAIALIVGSVAGKLLSKNK